MGKWRHEGYKNPYVPDLKIFNHVLSESEIRERYKMERKPIEAYESGYDAAIEALRKLATRSGKNLTKKQWMELWGTKAEGSGCIVFIPDNTLDEVERHESPA